MPEHLEGGDEEEVESNDGGAPIDPRVQDANTLELPDDMDFGDEVNLGGDDSQEMGDDEAAEDKMDDAEDEQRGEDIPTEKQDEKNRHPDDETGLTDQDIPGQPLEAENGDGTPEEEAHPNEEEGQKDEAVAQPDVTGGDGMASSEETHNPGGGENMEAGQDRYAQDTVCENTTSNSESKEDTRYVILGNSLEDFHLSFQVHARPTR